MRALRYLRAHGPASMSTVKLLGSFMHAGHLCLVLERLHGSLLDYLSHSSTLQPAVQLANLRQIAFQLLVMHVHANTNLLMHAIPLMQLGLAIGFCGADRSAASAADKITFVFKSL